MHKFADILILVLGGICFYPLGAIVSICLGEFILGSEKTRHDAIIAIQYLLGIFGGLIAMMAILFFFRMVYLV